MSNAIRLQHILSLVEEHGFISVIELSQLLNVSEMTIRRDLTELDRQKRLQRTYGGAASLRSGVSGEALGPDVSSIVQRVDVLIATALNPKLDGLLLEAIRSRNAIPIIGESLSEHENETVVAVDNFQAGLELGCWAGEYANRCFGGAACLLDLTYYLANTQLRSRGFIEGVRRTAGSLDVALSLDAQSRFETALQLTRDALTVHPQINMIFTLNDITAAGAIQACEELKLDPQRLAIFTFGLEGDTLKNALAEGRFCRAGLAMFPEVVGPVCIEAAIRAYNHAVLPAELITPHAVLSADNLGEYYRRTEARWEICWDKLRSAHAIPLDIFHELPLPASLPRRIGLVVPFIEHEWYQNLARTMRQHAAQAGIQFEIIDVHQSIKDEVDMRSREIARLAAREVQPGDVILLDAGVIANYLAEELLGKADLTVITNSIPAFEILRADPQIVLILTGGVHRASSQTLVGPTAENALRELRADKFFLTAAGVSLSFGLSHTHVADVTMKQAMLRSARQVILIADHTTFEQETMVQVAPLSAVDKLITDDVLPASLRLELTKLGIEVILASI
jgi:DeoR/GlpR family transcriptional regulator of sugar metabolism